MSVTIRYHGTLSDAKLLKRLEEEFVDIAMAHGWPREKVDGVYSSLRPEAAKGRGHGLVSTLSPPLKLRGVKLTVHPQTDPLWFTFDGEDAITRLGYYAVDHYAERKDSGAPSRRYEFVHQSQASIQTGIGGAPLHRTVVKLLDRLKSGYVPDLEVQDDSGYWETRDDALLEAAMQRR